MKKAKRSKKTRKQAEPKISPFLWYDDNAEQAAKFYVSIFKNSKVLNVSRSDEGPGKKPAVSFVSFELDGQRIMALNGGPQFTFTEAISFFVNCKTQKEIDYLWRRLTDGGQESRCGWLKDRFGLSWQIIPTILGDMLNDEDEVKSFRVMQAMLKMSKIDVKKLQQAYDGR